MGNQKCRPRKPEVEITFERKELVFVADIFGSRCRPMSGHVGSVISELGMVENVGVAALTASKSISVQKLFLLPVLVAAILNFGCRPVSGHVVSSISESGVVENVGVALGTASPSPSVQKLSLPLFFHMSIFEAAIQNIALSSKKFRT